MGFDLNRHWLEPYPWAHPTLYATKKLMMEADNSEVSYVLSFLFNNYISGTDTITFLNLFLLCLLISEWTHENLISVQEIYWQSGFNLNLASWIYGYIYNNSSFNISTILLQDFLLLMFNIKKREYSMKL